MILLVEDHVLFARVVAQMIEKLAPGTVVVHCRTLEESLQQTELQPSVVLLDLGLPDSNDMDGVRRVRQRYPQARIALLTGDETIDVAEAAAAGADKVLLKRWDVEAFLRDLAQALSGAA